MATYLLNTVQILSKYYQNIAIILNKQAGAELGQAKVKGEVVVEIRSSSCSVAPRLAWRKVL